MQIHPFPSTQGTPILAGRGSDRALRPLAKALTMDPRLLVLALGMFAMGTDNFVVAGILPSVAASLGTSVSLAGQMVAVYALSFAILAPVMAAVAGTWPRKPLLLAALAIFV